MNIAILGFGKVGKTLLDTMQHHPEFKKQFRVVGLWNRSPEAFQEVEIPADIKVYPQIEDLLSDLHNIDLVIECSHASVLHQYALEILKHTNLFVSSPTAFSQPSFYQEVIALLGQNNRRCYIPLGASVGVWDIIRLDQDHQIKSFRVDMKKHPESFKLNDKEAVKLLGVAMETPGEVVVADDHIAKINHIAPQNTNTMSIYALAAKDLGFLGCKGRIIADQSLDSHIIDCTLETHTGLKISFVRDNPASYGAVTGSATFDSFLNSLYHHSKGILHNHFIFC